MPVPSGAADGDGAGIGGIARRDVAEGHPAVDTLAGILIHDALPARPIADLTFGTLHRRAAGSPVHAHVVLRTVIAVVGGRAVARCRLAVIAIRDKKPHIGEVSDGDDGCEHEDAGGGAEGEFVAQNASLRKLPYRGERTLLRPLARRPSE